LFKLTKVITILKPGKYGSDPSQFRPMHAVVPVLQAGFRKNHSCTEKVLALTSQRKLKTGVVFINLTAAYDTV
jgi:hypothetical protein